MYEKKKGKIPRRGRGSVLSPTNSRFLPVEEEMSSPPEGRRMSFVCQEEESYLHQNTKPSRKERRSLPYEKKGISFRKEKGGKGFSSRKRKKGSRGCSR